MLPMPPPVRALFVLAFAFPLPAASGGEITLDPTFGTGGVVRSAFGSGNSDTPHDLALLPDGRILAAGRSDAGVASFIAMARYSADGVPDSTFGTAGRMLAGFVLLDWANALALQADGKIVVGGYRNTGTGSSSGRPCVYRFHADGTVDSTFSPFGGAHPFVYGIGDPRGEVTGLKVESDGTIVAAGRANDHINGGASGFGLARFLPDGNLQSSIRCDFPVSSQRGTAAFLEDGRVLHANTWTDPELALLRMLPDGSLDLTMDGFRFTGLPVYPYHPSMRALVLPDGKFLVATTTQPASGKQFTVFRFHADGLVDSTFGTAGRADVRFATNDELRDARVDTAGRIVLVGRAGVGFGRIGVARLLADGTPDPSFSDDGKTVQDVAGGAGTNYATQVRVLDDGNLLVAGVVYSGQFDFFLARLIVDDGTTAVAPPAGALLPATLSVGRPFPNPSAGPVELSLTLPEPRRVTMDVLDVRGRRVVRALDGALPAGVRGIRWDGLDGRGRPVRPGIYFLRVDAGTDRETRKVLVTR